MEQSATNKIIVVKFGGELAKNALVLKNMVEQVIALQKSGLKPVIVHGGGPQLDEACAQFGLEKKTINGRRITDQRTLELAKMVFAGKVRSIIVASFVKHGARAVGLSGFDGMLIRAKKRDAQLVVNKETGEKSLIDYGFVGDIVSIDTQILQLLLAKNFVPIISSLGSDDDGQILNINADTIAAEVALALQAETIAFITNVDGIYLDIKDPTSKIGNIGADDLQKLVLSESITGGMMPKVNSILRILQGGVSSAHVVNAFKQNALTKQLLENKGQGTMIARSETTISPGADHL